MDKLDHGVELVKVKIKYEPPKESICKRCGKTVPWGEGQWWQYAIISTVTSEGSIGGTDEVLLCPECVKAYSKTMENFMKGN